MGSMLKQTPLAEHRAQAKYPVHRIMKKNSKRKARNEKTFSCFPFLFQGMLSTFTSNRIIGCSIKLLKSLQQTKNISFIHHNRFRSSSSGYNIILFVSLS
jgi:hypothetical protein